MKIYLFCRRMNVLNRSICCFLVTTFAFIFSPVNCKADLTLDYFNFDFYIPEIIIDPTIPVYQFDFTDYNAFTGVTINNLESQTLSVNLGFDPDLGLDLAAGELVQTGFLLLDGTLALTVTPQDTSGGRAAIRTQYRMAVDPRALGRDAIRSLIRDQLGRDSGRIGARARLADARLMRFITGDAGGTWIRATDAIRGRADIRHMGDSVPDGVLGHHGFNETENYVWAVLDTNSKYAVGINLDHDGDGIVNSGDNCPYVVNTDQINTDADALGDACDDDDDNDSIADAADNCPLFANVAQADWDDDGIGDTCDFDDDNDNINDGLDLCLFTESGAVVNSDGCSIVELCDCNNVWKNHGAYMKCVAHATEDFVEDGLITEIEKEFVVSEAAQSSCGQK